MIPALDAGEVGVRVGRGQLRLDRLPLDAAARVGRARRGRAVHRRLRGGGELRLARARVGDAVRARLSEVDWSTLDPEMGWEFLVSGDTAGVA